MKPKTIRAWDKKNKRWYTWSFFIPDNLIDLIKQEGLILEKDMKQIKPNRITERTGE